MKMIHLARFCCVCLKKHKNLEKLSTIQNDYLRYNEKLSILIPQMDIEEIKDVVYVCKECKKCIDNMYNFRETCLNNNVTLWMYINKLRSGGNGGFVESIVLDKLDEKQINEYVDHVDVKEFEICNIKTEMNHLLTPELDEEHTEECDELIHMNIKKEVEIPYENDSGTEIYENIKIKNEDISSLHTIFEIDSMEDEVFNNGIGIEVDNDNEEYNVDTPPVEGINKSYSTKIDKKKKVNKSNKIKFRKLVGDNGEDYFKCGICFKHFFAYYYLQRHYIIHTGEKPYECEICNKTFARKGDLNIHSVVHTGEKPYECDVCNKKFTQKTSLRLHKRIHTGYKPFVCEICDKSFVKNYFLKLHRRTHTGERPFECDVCGKTFISGAHVNQHRKIHDKVKQRKHKCKICKEIFNFQSYLDSHIQEKHAS